MINSQELLYIVDKNNQPLKPQPRSFAHKNGLWHRTTGIWIMNRNKQLLCQKRSLKKDVKPGFWEAFFGGHLLAGEDYKHNAITEVKEELGMRIKAKDLIPYKVFKSDKPTHKEFQHVFAFVLHDRQNNFQFETDEIDELRWQDIKEVKEILVTKKNPKWVHKPWDEEVLNWLELFPGVKDSLGNGKK